MSELVIRNALPEQTAELVRNIFVNSNWRHAPFKDPVYYNDYCTDTNRGLPVSGETYSTDFWKCDSIIEDATVLSCVDAIVNTIDSVLSAARVDRRTISLLAYRLRPGGHLRVHDDKYGADVGFIWYLSKNWRWDWGGLLLSFPKDSPPVAQMPEFNKLVVLNHSEKISHCVTSVEPWAQDDRYMLVGMMRCVRD